MYIPTASRKVCRLNALHVASGVVGCGYSIEELQLNRIKDKRKAGYSVKNHNYFKRIKVKFQRLIMVLSLETLQ